MKWKMSLILQEITNNQLQTCELPTNTLRMKWISFTQQIEWSKKRSVCCKRGRNKSDHVHYFFSNWKQKSSRKFGMMNTMKNATINNCLDTLRATKDNTWIILFFYFIYFILNVGKLRQNWIFSGSSKFIIFMVNLNERKYHSSRGSGRIRSLTVVS